MAIDTTLGGNGSLFADEDKTFILEVLAFEPDGVYDAASVPENISGWPIVFDVRKRDDSPAPALLSKTATVTGTYNATRSSNTQRAIVTVSAAEMHQFKGSNLPTLDGAVTYRYSFKLMTAGQETVLARGDFAPEKATAP